MAWRPGQGRQSRQCQQVAGADGLHAPPAICKRAPSKVPTAAAAVNEVSVAAPMKSEPPSSRVTNMGRVDSTVT